MRRFSLFAITLYVFKLSWSEFGMIDTNVTPSSVIDGCLSLLVSFFSFVYLVLELGELRAFAVSEFERMRDGKA